MRGAVFLFVLAVYGSAWAGSVPPSAMVTFEGFADGTVFGPEAGHVPGDAVLSQNGIIMRVQNFHFQDFVGFYRAEIGGLFEPYFPSTPLETNNINVEFDFSGLPFSVQRVTFEYLDFGGISNLSVNGGTLYELASLSDLPSSIAPGIEASVQPGLVTLLGPIASLQVGGQELGIDNVIAVPEPGMIILGLLAGLSLSTRFRNRIGK